MNPAPHRRAEPRKGEVTRGVILEAALELASRAGFESLTIGALAHRTGLSKSGLFAHFGSREELQVAAIELAAARFTALVFVPALEARRGLPRVRALFNNWLEWSARSGLAHGCPMQSAAVEYDDQPGAVRDAVLGHFERLERELQRAVGLAVEQNQLRAQLDVPQFVFELTGIVLACHQSARLLGRGDAAARAAAAFTRLVDAALPRAGADG